jgi:hypothetical protein
MKKIALLLFLICNIGWSQTYMVEGLSVKKFNEKILITFKNGNEPGFYLNGQFLNSYGRLILSIQEYELFIEDLSKAAKKSNTTIEREAYVVNKFEFSKEDVYFTVFDNIVNKEKVGTIKKEQIKIIQKL